MFTSLQLWFEIGLGLSGIIGGLISGIVYTKIKAKTEEKKQIEESAINGNGSAYQAKHTIVHETLTSLRILCGANRARIAHFHNGGKFLDGTPMKKFSITHESCEKGTPYDGANLQNILVTMFWNLIETMRLNNTNIMTTDNMPDGYYRSYNKSTGVVAYAILPILKQDLYIGFIELEWFDIDNVPINLKSFRHDFEQAKDFIELELAIR